MNFNKSVLDMLLTAWQTNGIVLTPECMYDTFPEGSCDIVETPPVSKETATVVAILARRYLVDLGMRTSQSTGIYDTWRTDDIETVLERYGPQRLWRMVGRSAEVFKHPKLFTSLSAYVGSNEAQEREATACYRTRSLLLLVESIDNLLLRNLCTCKNVSILDIQGQHVRNGTFDFMAYPRNHMFVCDWTHLPLKCVKDTLSTLRGTKRKMLHVITDREFLSTLLREVSYGVEILDTSTTQVTYRELKCRGTEPSDCTYTGKLARIAVKNGFLDPK